MAGTSKPSRASGRGAGKKPATHSRKKTSSGSPGRDAKRAAASRAAKAPKPARSGKALKASKAPPGKPKPTARPDHRLKKTRRVASPARPKTAPRSAAPSKSAAASRRKGPVPPPKSGLQGRAASAAGRISARVKHGASQGVARIREGLNRAGAAARDAREAKAPKARGAAPRPPSAPAAPLPEKTAAKARPGRAGKGSGPAAEGEEPARSARASKKRAAERRSRISATTDWEDLMALADPDSVRPYQMKESYAKGDVIRHKVFGIGIVVREIPAQKIQVSFKDGVKLLVCNWP